MDLFNPDAREVVKIFGAEINLPHKGSKENIIVCRYKNDIINFRIILENGKHIDNPIAVAQFGKTQDQFVVEFKKLKEKLGISYRCY